MHFCTVPNQKTWTAYNLFKTKPSNLFSLLVNMIAHSLLMNTLHWLPIRERIISVCMFSNVSREVHQNTLRTFFIRKLKPASGPLTRPSADTSLLIAHVEKNRIGHKSFYVSTPSLWNSLPRNIREACTLSSFRKVLKSHLYPSY